MTERVKISEKQFDWNEIISKPVITTDDKSIGHIDGVMETEFIVKQRFISPHYVVDRIHNADSQI
jgi:hypothetical protein